MRRKDREMSKDFALEVADKCEYAVLSMTDAHNAPYCVPISIVRVRQTVYFHCAKEGEKIDCLRANPQVCLACVGDTHRMPNIFTTEFESAILRGTASEVTDAQEKITALKHLCERHTPTNMANFDSEVASSLDRTAVWKIEIESITGKRKKYDENGKEMKFGRMATSAI